MLRVALDMLYVLIGLTARIVERIAAPLAWLLLAAMLSASHCTACDADRYKLELTCLIFSRRFGC